MAEEIAKLYIKFDADGRPYVKGLRQLEGETDKSGRAMTSAWDKYGKKAGVAAAAGLAIVAAAGVKVGMSVVKTAASFEYEFSRIKANANGTAKELDALRGVVIQLGKDTAFSAGETAQAANELVKAGLSVQETIGALPGMLDLAAAGELGVAQAAEITANTLAQFGLAAADAGAVADTLALAANRSTTEVSMLGQSLENVGTIAAGMGWTIQETSAALALLANNGVKGAEAGTALKSMLMQLMTPTADAAKLLERYGISLYDTLGQTVSASTLMERLSVAFVGLTDAERDYAAGKIFGSYGIRAANILIKEGADAYRDMTEAVSQSGAAQDVAATKLDNLYGSWEQLKGSVETLAIQLGTKALPLIREFVDDLSGVVDDAIETGDWGALGEEMGRLIGEGIKAATPYIVEALVVVTEAAARSLPGIVGAADLALVETMLGVNEPQLQKQKSYIAKRMASVYKDLPRDQAFTEAFRELQSYGWRMWHTLTPYTSGVKTHEEMMALAASFGLTFTDNEFRQIEETNRQQFDRILSGRSAPPPGPLWQPGQKTTDAFRGLATGLAAATKEADSHAKAAAALAAKEEDLSARIAELAKSYDAGVSPTDAWTAAVERSAAAAKKSKTEFDEALTSAKEWAKALQEEIAAAVAYEQNIYSLMRTFGAEFDPMTLVETLSRLTPIQASTLIKAKPEDARKIIDDLMTAAYYATEEHKANFLRRALGYGEEAGKTGWKGIGRGWINEQSLHSLTLAAGVNTDMSGVAAKAHASFKTNFESIMARQKVKVSYDVYGNVVLGGAEAGAGLLTGKVPGLARSTANVWTTLKSAHPYAQWLGGYARSGHVKGSDHYTGHAFDVSGSKAQMQAMANSLARNFNAWGIKQIIHNRLQNRGSGWYPYKGPNPHTGHVHVSTYADGGWVLPPPQTSTGQAVPAILHAGEYVLTQNQAQALFAQARSFADGGYVLPDSIFPSYIAREQARYGMYEVGGIGNIALLTQTLTRQIELLDEAVREAEATLATAKQKGNQEQINEAARALFNLKRDAALARQEMEALARTPFEAAVNRWSAAASQFGSMMSLVGNHSNALSMQSAILPSLMGAMGAQYQSNYDLMGLASTPDQVMQYANAAIGDLSSMFGAEQGLVNRALSDTLSSIDSGQASWQKSWQARSDAVSEAAESQREALNKSLSTLQKNQQEELSALAAGYDRRLEAMQAGERAITREQQRNQESRKASSLADELRILRGQGFYTAADIARMRELETQLQDQHDSMAQQEGAWARDDARMALEREKEQQVKLLQQQQEAALERLRSQIEAQEKALQAQQKAQRQEYEAQMQAFDRQREAARRAAQDEIDNLVVKYQQMMQQVIDRQNELLAKSGDYQNAGYALGQSFAQGLIDALPLIQQAAQAAAQSAADYLELHSPAKLGPLSGIDNWWREFVPTLVRPLDTAGPADAASRVAASVGRGVIRSEDTIRIEFSGNAEGLDVQQVADLVERRIQRKIEARGRER